ncbi:3-deoxy-D-manno-octulosonic acid transferase [Fontivita pretiosa]|uniref:3-deoxy-D-manno-octulosonic acid transferase n=1 Tax=Fontivita pretiosa TaxID=2989684 RepID=UPI003D17EA50
MINFYDIAYGLGVAVSAPYWVIKPSARSKVLSAFSQRMGDVARRQSDATAVMIHAVSVGEINATRALVHELRLRRRDLHIIISTTTRTGYQRAQELYGAAPHVTLIRYPLDFTPAVTRVLDSLRPSLVVLMELEVWPNFMQQCRKRNIPVILANGRLTSSSFRRYRLVRPIAASMFSRLAMVCAQDETYAGRFEALGVPRDRILVTGTMKFDTAQVADSVSGDATLAWALGLNRGAEPIWVCGSTGPGEEQIILREYRNLLATFRRLRLVIVPRKPERFDEVAALIEQFRFTCLRRSRNLPPPIDPPVPPVILGDTMGELRKFYSIADIVFVGRSLVDLGPRQHGSDMIEPAALAKPIIVGPHTGNFEQPMRLLKAADAVLEVVDGESLNQAVRVLISTPAEAKAMGRRAQQVVRAARGATQRHVEVILNALASVKPQS